ncbi:MAG: chromate transporter [Treponema sp.]|nr:chromate transporter [Treponema sp.]
MKKMPMLLELFLSFAKIGAVTFGGGMAMMPILQRDLIEKKRWMSEDELLDYYAIGQSTPGIIAINVSTFVGFKQAGILGGIVATLGMVLPSLVIISLIATFISSIDHLLWAQKALKGINVSVAALLTSVVLQFSKKTIKSLIGFLCFAVSFIAIFFFHIPSYVMIVAGALLGVVLYATSQKKNLERVQSGRQEIDGEEQKTDSAERKSYGDGKNSNAEQKTDGGAQ